MKSFKEYILIAVGVILVAIAVQYFFAPNNLAAGGVTGLAIIIKSFMPSVNLGIITLSIDIILFIVSFIVLGKDFSKRTVVTGLALSGVIWFIGMFLEPYAIVDDLIIASIFGAGIAGFGMAIVFNNYSSTGGSDIVAKIISKYTNMNIGTSLMSIDIVITVLAAIIFGIDKGFYAILSVIILGLVVDRFIDGFNSCKEIFIISEHEEEISKFIMNELERGCTYLDGKGAYTNKEVRIVYAIIQRNEFIKLKAFIKKNDLKAFISVRESYEVLGEGFKEM